MAFRHPWRDYQASVLAQLESHLEDQKLHVVAAPGAGKTVLGLEVVRRIGKPTLVLTPSLAIRGQWIDRLCDLFLGGTRPDWISDNLSAPGLLTVSTYQALHSEVDLDTLRAAGVAVVVLDEAHHLRRAWWAALDHVVEALEARTVSLTATPPYDVASSEWQRYNALCGPLDAEISVPELVRSGDLAPHQDLVHLTELRDGRAYADLDAANDRLRAGLVRRDDLCALIKGHPWVTDPRTHIDALLSEPELFSAMLIYLHDAGRPLPDEALRILGVGRAQIPSLTDQWLNALCQGLLPDLPDGVTAHLKACGALSRGRVSVPLRDEDARVGMLRNAPEKFQSIDAILSFERAALGDALRTAILCEHVGAGAVTLATKDPGFYTPQRFEQEIAAEPNIGKLEAGSVFERLRAGTDNPDDLAVLTGSLCVVPTGSISGEGIKATPLPHDPRYESLTLSGQAADRRVALISSLVARGVVRVLIGTRALLGQGWDLPALNTLILATNVASFVSSNQIRGRVIRRNPDAPAKAAHIWHIGTCPPGGGGPEMQALADRFDTFVHLDPEAGEIRSGFDAGETPDQINALSFKRAARRGQMAQDWQSALQTEGPNPHIRHSVSTVATPRGLVRTDAIAQAVPRLGAAATLTGGWAIALADPWSGAAALGASGLIAAPALPRLKRALDHGTLAGSLRQTGLALLHALHKTQMIRTPRAQLDVETGQNPDRAAWATLTGGTLPEETRFLAQLEELFAPIDNPRYLLIRESYLGRRLRLAPYPVPRDLGRRKEEATAFLDGWRRHVGPARLVFTRTVEGRLALLQSRTVTLADARKVTRRSVWR